MASLSVILFKIDAKNLVVSQLAMSEAGEVWSLEPYSAFNPGDEPSETHELSMMTTISSPVCCAQTSCTLDVEFVVPLMSSDTHMLRSFLVLISSYSGVKVSSAPIRTASAGLQRCLNLSGKGDR